MLFLAVFCGFLAENQREHYVEHQRERVYIKSLKADVENDLRQIDTLLPELNAFIARLDSISLGIVGTQGSDLPLQVSHLLKKGVGFSDFIYNDRTIQQLKNAGNMRLIRNTIVANAISAYDASVRRGIVHQDLINEYYMPRLNEKINYLFDLTAFHWPVTVKNKHDAKGFLLTSDHTEKIRFINDIFFYRRAIEVLASFIANNGIHGKNLLRLIKKEYILN